MKNGKRPTKKQAIFLNKNKLKSTEWLISEINHGNKTITIVNRNDSNKTIVLPNYIYQ